MQDKILIIGKKPYSFTNDKNEVVSGTKVSYLNKHSDENGHLPIQISVSEQIAKNIIKAPGVYTCQYAMLPGKGNKPTLTIVGFEFVEEYEFDF